MLEIDQAELSEFVANLEIKQRFAPAKSGFANPCINGWNVWPHSARTFVPGNEDLNRLKQTWKGDAAPVEMLSCASTKGDWLHVEIWSISDGTLIKIYTDWN